MRSAVELHLSARHKARANRSDPIPAVIHDWGIDARQLKRQVARGAPDSVWQH
jgi:hypothetical protein